ncbi:MAG: methyltransferase domain-containing protein [Chloroflexi bacterium]|nr:methyltransferase domain-containing protein [Chloroflexota bacterium]
MEQHDLQSYTNQLYDDLASTYEDQPGHGFASLAEQEAWETDLREAFRISVGAPVLDVGTGTGVFARLFASWGCQVVGLDPSVQMLAEAERRVPSALQSAITFVAGDTVRDGALFPASSFTAIVSRQVVCHLTDPLAAFRHWYTWLQPAGQVLVVDGLWSRAGWSDDQMGDALPLACLQTRATIPYLLEQVGFQVVHNGWLERVNQALGSTQTSPRYLVIARKPGEPAP